MENNMNNISQKPTDQNGIGPVIGSVIVIVVVIVGGFYFWGGKITKDRQSTAVQNQAMSASHNIDSSESDNGIPQSDISDEDLKRMEKDLPKL